MSTVAFLSPMTIHQLITWQRKGIHSLQSGNGVWVRIQEEDKPILSPEIKKRLAEIAPVFEDDLELLFVLVQDQAATDFLVAGQASWSCLVRISSLKCAFPISDRGAKLLEGKIDSSIPLRSPIEIEEIRAREIQWSRESRRAAAEQILKALSLGMLAEHDSQTSELALRIMMSPKGLEHEGTLESVLRYARQFRPGTPPISSNDIGYFEDLGRILGDLSKTGSGPKREALKGLRSALDRVKEPNPALPFAAVLAGIREQLSVFDAACAPLSPLSIALYLKLRDAIGDPDAAGLKSIATTMAELSPDTRSESALAAWLAGATAGFARASEFCAVLPSVGDVPPAATTAPELPTNAQPGGTESEGSGEKPGLTESQIPEGVTEAPTDSAGDDASHPVPEPLIQQSPQPSGTPEVESDATHAHDPKDKGDATKDQKGPDASQGESSSDSKFSPIDNSDEEEDQDAKAKRETDDAVPAPDAGGDKRKLVGGSDQASLFADNEPAES
jgi:hypothetical protein